MSVERDVEIDVVAGDEAAAEGGRVDPGACTCGAGREKFKRRSGITVGEDGLVADVGEVNTASCLVGARIPRGVHVRQCRTYGAKRGIKKCAHQCWQRDLAY